MALKLYLKPKEKIIINQAVIVNGDNKTEILLQNQANVMREKDILTEDKAVTPASRAYFSVQLLYLFPELKEKNKKNALQFLQDYAEAATSSKEIVYDIRAKLENEDYYGALKGCRDLIHHESEVLQDAKQGPA